jgi:hypothetical protein
LNAFKISIEAERGVVKGIFERVQIGECAGSAIDRADLGDDSVVGDGEWRCHGFT